MVRLIRQKKQRYVSVSWLARKKCSRKMVTRMNGIQVSLRLSHQAWANIECKTDNHIPWLSSGVQATEHRTKALGDRKQRSCGRPRATSGNKLWINWSSTDVSPADVRIPPPALPPSAHPARLTSHKSGGKHNLLMLPKTRIAKYADPRKLRERHAKNNPDDRADRILNGRRIWRYVNSRPKGFQ